MGKLPLAERESILVLSVPAICLALILLGRHLEHRKGVGLGWLYHPFAVHLAIFVLSTITPGRIYLLQNLRNIKPPSWVNFVVPVLNYEDNNKFPHSNAS
jgi:hypothetical protein